MQIRISLKNIIADYLSAVGIASYEDIRDLAEKYGSKPSVVERRLRGGELWDLPVQKLSSKKKPVKNSERIEYYRWTGTKVSLRKKI